MAVFMAAAGTPGAGMQADTIEVTMAIAGDMFMRVLSVDGVFITR